MFGIKGKIVAVSLSQQKGVKKQNVKSVAVKENLGIKGDAHAQKGPRQISLLAEESINKMRAKGLKVFPGDFAENITFTGINLSSLKTDVKLKIGKSVLLKISQIGKDCHSPCSIYYQAGDCVMRREGIFAQVLKGGIIKNGDQIKIEGEKCIKLPS